MLQPYVWHKNLSVEGEKNGKWAKARERRSTVLLVRANIKMNVEGRFYSDHEPQEAAGKEKNLDDRMFVCLDYAF